MDFRNPGTVLPRSVTGPVDGTVLDIRLTSDQPGGVNYDIYLNVDGARVGRLNGDTDPVTLTAGKVVPAGNHIITVTVAGPYAPDQIFGASLTHVVLRADLLPPDDLDGAPATTTTTSSNGTTGGL